MKRFSYTFDGVWGQLYIIPTVSITYDKTLNGYYEISIWWLTKVLSLRYE